MPQAHHPLQVLRPLRALLQHRQAVAPVSNLYRAMQSSRKSLHLGIRRRVSGTVKLLRLALMGVLPLANGCTDGGQPVTHPDSVISKAGHFEDVTQAAGLNYVWSIPGKRPLNILQTIGNGCAFLDYDNDGNLDILLVGSKLALYKGDGKGHFNDVTHETGLDTLQGHFLGCAVGDYDNDGYDDLYITAYRGGVLLHNEGGKRFTDVTKAAGLLPQPWGTSCAFAETRPGSGLLDLYVANYAHFDPATDQQLCPENGVMTSCGPRTYKPIRGVMYLNDGSGHFHEATDASGLQTATGRGLGIGFIDFDGSGKPGLAISNDEIPGDLFQPVHPQDKQKTLFHNVGLTSGTGFDINGNIHGGMGLDWGDYDNDGKPDLFVATFQNEAKCLYHNDGEGVFRDVSPSAGLGATVPNVSFGCKFFDYDNDGRLDLVIANGHVLDNIAQIRPTATYRQSAQLLHNRGEAGATFEDVNGTVGGAGFAKPIVGRGVAVGDYDNDGRMDTLIVDSEGVPLLLHNEIDVTGRHFLGLKLIGAQSNRNGYGAIATAVLNDGRKIVRICHADGSYMSSSDSRVHFGLGASSLVAVLTIKWPDGHTDTFKNVNGDRYFIVREGQSALR